MADVDPPFGEEILDVPEGKGVFHVHQNYEADYLGR